MEQKWRLVFFCLFYYYLKKRNEIGILSNVQSKEFGGDPRQLIVPDVAPTVVTEFSHQGDDKEQLYSNDAVHQAETVVSISTGGQLIVHIVVVAVPVVVAHGFWQQVNDLQHLLTVA